MSYFAIQVSEADPKNLTIADLLEVVIRFWRKFLRDHAPYKDLPVGKTQLSEP
jgi:hypothetical protein